MKPGRRLSMHQTAPLLATFQGMLSLEMVPMISRSVRALPCSSHGNEMAAQLSPP